jgi:hypothetical protein
LNIHVQRILFDDYLAGKITGCGWSALEDGKNN